MDDPLIHLGNLYHDALLKKATARRNYRACQSELAKGTGSPTALEDADADLALALSVSFTTGTQFTAALLAVDISQYSDLVSAHLRWGLALDAVTLSTPETYGPATQALAWAQAAWAAAVKLRVDNVDDVA
jgi:hypothetical protein